MCKAIRYEIARDQCQERMNMSICHCGFCQSYSGSAFSIGLVVPAMAFRIFDPQGLVKTYELPDVPLRIAFCSKCGCYLMHEPTVEPGSAVSSLRVLSGTLDQNSKGFVAGPATEIHVKTRMSWLPELQGAKQIQDFGTWPQSWQ